MRVCYILFGFSRIMHSSDVLHNYFKHILPDDTEIDIYWYCPRTRDAHDSTLINITELQNAFTGAGLGEVHIEWFDYNPVPFYYKVRELGFTLKDTFSMRHSPSRKLSLVYNMSKSAELAYTISNARGIRYDLAIMSRYDFIPHVIYNFPSALNDGVYLFREYMEYNVQCAEDRAFYGTPEYIFELRNFYNNIERVFTESAYYSEVLLTKYYMTILDKSKLFLIENMKIPLIITPNNILNLAKTEELKYIRESAESKLD